MDKAEKIKRLRETLQPGDTVRTILRHVSRSGMTRDISLVVVENGEDTEIDWLCAEVLGLKINRYHGGLRVGGCGMDMGFHLVYELSHVLFPDGFGNMGQASLYPKGIRPTTKTHADKLRGKGVEFRGRNGDPSGWDNDGGYALKQRWL